MSDIILDNSIILVGDVIKRLREIPDETVRTCVTSPPYFGLRDYGVDGQIGLELTPDEYVARMVEVFREVRRVLTKDGTLWLNVGDSYASSPRGNKPGDHSTSSLTNPQRQDGVERGGLDKSKLPGVKQKDLIGIPWMLAFALRTDGWYLRSDIIWQKPNCMPEAVKDRPTRAHEYIFLLTKSRKYFYDHEAVKEPAKDWSKGGPGTGIKTTEHYGASNGGNSGLGELAARYKDGEAPLTRNRRSVWTVSTKATKGAHFATYPVALIEPCILAGSTVGDIVLDPFLGSGTTAVAASLHGRQCIGVELNPEYAVLAENRIRRETE